MPVPLQNAVTSHDLRISARRLRCPVVLVDDTAEDLAAPHGASSCTTAISSWSGGRCCRDWCGRCGCCDTRSHVVSELVEEVWLMPEI